MFKKIILNFVSILAINLVVPVFKFDSLITLLIGSVVLSLLNMTVKPILHILFLPMSVITLGLFGWVINGVVLGLAVYLVPNLTLQQLAPFGLEIGWVLSLMLLALLLSITQRLIDIVI